MELIMYSRNIGPYHLKQAYFPVQDVNNCTRWDWNSLLVKMLLIWHSELLKKESSSFSIILHFWTIISRKKQNNKNKIREKIEKAKFGSFLVIFQNQIPSQNLYHLPNFTSKPSSNQKSNPIWFLWKINSKIVTRLLKIIIYHYLTIFSALLYN